ncbi:hypothetical protein [Tabrizicola sp.]|uniref:hypothetical protein n=1 Tax=Tabrizicola sp. TaxID=2005166 RepID=UPI003F2EAE5B
MANLRVTEMIGPEFLLIGASGAILLVGSGTGLTTVALAVGLGLLATVGIALGSAKLIGMTRQRVADYRLHRRDPRAA